jgi:hypothetical protein
MGFLDGLFFYEIVLLFAGIILFLVLLFVLVYFVIKARPDKQLRILVPLFGLSVVMIGWTSITKIKIGKDIVEIEKEAHQVAQNPSNDEAKENLKASLADLEKRSFTNPRNLVSLAKAQAAVGDTTQARINLDSALKKKPNLREATILRDNLRRP